jgi:AcrR family transcriptional regulator
MRILERAFHKIDVPYRAGRKSRGYTLAMARPREFDVDEALDRATEVFWKRGYEATSIQDLVDALGVNRASLYGTFGDKAQLFTAVLDRYEMQVNLLVEEALASPAAGAEAVRAWFRALIGMVAQPAGPRGCLLIGSVSSCTTAPSPLRERVVAAVRASTDRLQEALARDPEIGRREDVRTLARFFAAEGHGLAVLARAGVRRQELEAAAEVALRVLEPRSERI